MRDVHVNKLSVKMLNHKIIKLRRCSSVVGCSGWDGRRNKNTSKFNALGARGQNVLLNYKTNPT